MKKLLLILLCLPMIGFGQNNTPSLVSSSGDYYATPDIYMEYSLGEIVIETFLPANNPLPLVYNILTQGFHQEKLTVQTSLVELEVISKVYPNPTTDMLIIELEQNVVADLIVYDINGKVVLEDKLNKEQSKQLDFSYLTQGNYLLHINIADKKSVYKIQKLK